MSDPSAEGPSPAELVRRVVEALVDRTLTFARGTRVPVRVRPLPLWAPGGDGGVVVDLVTLGGRRPARWVLPRATWDDWRGAWEASRPSAEGQASDKALMLLLTGALDRWQLEAAGPGGLPGYPFPGTWAPDEVRSWAREGARWTWFEVRTPTHGAWLGLDPPLASTGERLATEPGFRALVREEVLGEACGRLGVDRPWMPSSRGALALGSDFVLGPCLLPVFGQEGSLVPPRFHGADPDKAVLGAEEPLLLHTFGWDDREFTLVYRLPGVEDPFPWLAELVRTSGRLLPFASLVDRPPGPSSWSQAEALPSSTESWLRIGADHGAGTPTWEVLVPAELLNTLATFGSRPWEWTWLTAGADNLLRVFVGVNDRFRHRPPAGFADRAGFGWADDWYGEALAAGPPDRGLLVADLLGAVPAVDRVRIVQNLLVPERSLHPLRALFTWAEEDPVAGLVPFQLVGFDREAFAALLPPLVRDDWDRWGAEYQGQADLLAANHRAVAALWDAWRRGRIELTDTAVDLVREGFAEPRRVWRERRARERTGPGLAALLDQARPSPRLVAVLQRSGPQALALALLYDEAASRRIREWTSRAFAAEFGERQAAWVEAFREDGPDYEAFDRTLGDLEDAVKAAVPRNP